MPCRLLSSTQTCNCPQSLRQPLSKTIPGRRDSCLRAQWTPMDWYLSEAEQGNQEVQRLLSAAEKHHTSGEVLTASEELAQQLPSCKRSRVNCSRSMITCACSRTSPARMWLIKQRNEAMMESLHTCRSQSARNRGYAERHRARGGIVCRQSTASSSARGHSQSVRNSSNLVTDSTTTGTIYKPRLWATSKRMPKPAARRPARGSSSNMPTNSYVKPVGRHSR